MAGFHVAAGLRHPIGVAAEWLFVKHEDLAHRRGGDVMALPARALTRSIVHCAPSTWASPFGHYKGGTDPSAGGATAVFTGHVTGTEDPAPSFRMTMSRSPQIAAA